MESPEWLAPKGRTYEVARFHWKLDDDEEEEQEEAQQQHERVMSGAGGHLRLPLPLAPPGENGANMDDGDAIWALISPYSEPSSPTDSAFAEEGGEEEEEKQGGGDEIKTPGDGSPVTSNEASCVAVEDSVSNNNAEEQRPQPQQMQPFGESVNPSWQILEEEERQQRLPFALEPHAREPLTAVVNRDASRFPRSPHSPRLDDSEDASKSSPPLTLTLPTSRHLSDTEDLDDLSEPAQPLSPSASIGSSTCCSPSSTSSFSSVQWTTEPRVTSAHSTVQQAYEKLRAHVTTRLRPIRPHARVSGDEEEEEDDGDFSSDDEDCVRDRRRGRDHDQRSSLLPLRTSAISFSAPRLSANRVTQASSSLPSKAAMAKMLRLRSVSTATTVSECSMVGDLGRPSGISGVGEPTPSTAAGSMHASVNEGHGHPIQVKELRERATAGASRVAGYLNAASLEAARQFKSRAFRTRTNTRNPPRQGREEEGEEQTEEDEEEGMEEDRPKPWIRNTRPYNRGASAVREAAVP